MAAMKILVAGAQGQLARALVDAARVRRGFDVVVMGRPQLDLRDTATVAQAFAAVEPDLLINAAAYTAVDKAESDPAAALAINRDGAAALAAVADGYACPVIHLSTDYVFDGTKAEPYVESDRVGPASVYGRSKLEGEIAVMAANARHVILRTAWLYAPYGLNFLRTVVRLARERPQLRIVADQWGNPTYVPHLAHAVLSIAAQIGAAAPGAGMWGTYHGAAGGETTWAGFAAEIIRVGAPHGLPTVPVVPIATDEYPVAARRPANSRLDCTKLARTFGVRLPPWQQGVEECLPRLIRETRV
ncbi:MAG: dTDP-4-dehydrorhamnose reductase [Hyphomonadaceae bacterium]|jgi:dTDP-4-dehydrorhamnose reductase|nr:dTDP-4-dehydrorhamnose reductase [Hyphomonadaceae bacterium]